MRSMRTVAVVLLTFQLEFCLSHNYLVSLAQDSYGIHLQSKSDLMKQF